MKIIDNFLGDEYLQPIIERVSGSWFPWYWSEVLDERNFLEDLKYNFQLGHTLFRDNTFTNQEFHLFLPLLDRLNIKSLHRIKLNLTPITSKIIEQGYHIDNEFSDHTTAVFYLNTNNGYTKFQSTGEKVYSVKNRLVTFPSSAYHTGTTCTDSSRRLVLNINYVQETE